MTESEELAEIKRINRRMWYFLAFVALCAIIYILVQQHKINKLQSGAVKTKITTNKAKLDTNAAKTATVIKDIPKAVKSAENTIKQRNATRHEKTVIVRDTTDDYKLRYITNIHNH